MGGQTAYHDRKSSHALAFLLPSRQDDTHTFSRSACLIQQDSDVGCMEMENPFHRSKIDWETCNRRLRED